MTVTMAKKKYEKRWKITITLFILAAAVKPKESKWVGELANMRTRLDKVSGRGFRWAWIKSMPLQRLLGVLSKSGIFSCGFIRFYYKLLRLLSLNDHLFVHMYNSLHYSSRMWEMTCLLPLTTENIFSELGSRRRLWESNASKKLALQIIHESFKVFVRPQSYFWKTVTELCKFKRKLHKSTWRVSCGDFEH